MRGVISSKTAVLFLVFVAVCALMPPVAHAQKQSSVPVTSTIDDGTGFQIQSDKEGLYTNSKTVQSIIQSGGDWVLDTNYSRYSTRSVFLDLSHPVVAGAEAPFAAGLVKARLITQCPPYGNSLLEMTAGDSIACGLVIHFDYNGNGYRLAMNPLGAYGFEDSTTVGVSCDTAAAAGTCNQWHIGSPNDYYYCDTFDSQGQCLNWISTATGIAKLVQVGVRGRTVADLGYFYLSFAIHVTNP